VNTEQKIYLDMVGCRLNQSELEHIGRQARQAGYTLVGEISEADVMIINTCAVTAKAASDSRMMARNAARQGVGQIILTGCWASLNLNSAASLPAVTHVVPNHLKHQLTRLTLGSPQDDIQLEPVKRQSLPGVRKRTRAFIKVQDGCDRRCTFCVTTIARGAIRSDPIPEVLAEIQAAAASGVKEVILTGVHLASWGSDFKEGGSVEQLVRSILYHTDIPRLRLSSLEPWNLPESFFDLWQDPRLCQHLHLPLQSGSSRILRRMARNTTPSHFRSLIERIRQQYPQMAITTDIIVGFPGEGDLEFEQSRFFVREMEFSGGHVFTYSERPGTAAADFPGSIPNGIRRARNRRMRFELESARKKYQLGFIGRTVSVLWEKATPKDDQSWVMHGWSSENLRVQASGEASWHNQIQPVLLTARLEDGMLSGSIVLIRDPAK
jgi:threonylcarbamoyladenosine tRNA methylthiotransferase MtaB